MPTIHDVAKRAGVAPITVSRVINNSGYISKETHERVEAAIAELGYVPNRLARSLRSKRTDTLALVLTDITNPFFTMIARGVEDTAGEAGFIVIFCNTDESEAKEQKYLDVVLQRKVDGVLLVPAGSTLTSFGLIKKHKVPVVVLDRRIPEAETDVVRCDSESGAHQLTSLLLDHGHRRIAVLSGPAGISTAEDRVAGYRRAMAEYGITLDEKYVIYGRFNQESGYEMACRVLSIEPRPTALFAANNFIAIGVMNALSDAGLRVPEDIALVGFDDLPASLASCTFLTVVAQPAYEMGRQATHLLLKRLSGEAPQQFQEVLLPTEMIVRQSVRRVDVEERN